MTTFIFLLVVIIIFVQISNLKSKVNQLEKSLNSLKPQSPTPNPQTATPVSNDSAQTTATTLPLSAAELALNTKNDQLLRAESMTAPKPSNDFDVGLWLTTDWPLKLGALLLLIALGWFVSYAFMNNWIGPVGRIFLGFLTGSLMIGFAEWWHQRSTSQSTVLYGLGTATVMITVFAARVIYSMFDPISTILIVNFAALVVSASSFKHNLESRAVIGLVAALVVPLLTHSPSTNYLSLLWYLSAITVGYAWLVWMKGWRPMLAVLMTGLFFYLVPIITTMGSTFGMGMMYDQGSSVNYLLKTTVLQFSIFFTLLLFTTNLALLAKERSADVWNVVIGSVLGIFTLFLIITLVPEHLQGLSAMGASLLFILGSFIVSKVKNNKAPVLVYSGVAIALLGAAIALQLSGAAMVIAFILLATSVILVGTLLMTDRSEARPLGLLMCIPAIFSMPMLTSSEWSYKIPLSDFAVLSIMTVALLFLASFLREKLYADDEPNNRRWIAAYDIAGLAYGLATVWLVNQALFEESTATAISLILFTMIGLGFYIAGKIRHGGIMRTTGIVLLIGVTARLLLVEVWNMPIAGRIVTFALIGVMFMVTTLFERGIVKKWTHE